MLQYNSEYWLVVTHANNRLVFTPPYTHLFMMMYLSWAEINEQSNNCYLIRKTMFLNMQSRYVGCRLHFCWTFDFEAIISRGRSQSYSESFPGLNYCRKYSFPNSCSQVVYFYIFMTLFIITSCVFRPFCDPIMSVTKYHYWCSLINLTRYSRF